MEAAVEHTHWFQIAVLLVVHALSWFVVVHALLHKHDPRAALGWIAAVLFLPLIGALLYFSIGINRANSRAAKLMAYAAEVAGKHRRRLGDSDAQSATFPQLSLHSEDLPTRFFLASVGEKVTGRKLAGGNALTPLFNGEEAYPAMLDAIRNASAEVFLSSYIFNDGVAGKAFVAELAKAAQRGIDVRVLVDGIGSLYSLRAPWRNLRRKGIRVARFLPPRITPWHLSINLRNHRKILVCDANVGFTGGMNISDNHLVELPASHRVRDVHFACKGPLVEQLRDAFLLDWGFVTGHYEQHRTNCQGEMGNCLCRIILEGPGTSTDQLHDILCAVITGAKRRVSLMTPYFLPTHELIGSLRATALRGVRVDVLLPATNNLPYMHWATRHLLPQLIQAGVHVRYQPGPFAHTKLLLIDDGYAQIGSANIDSRSLRLNFELNVEVFNTAFVRQMRTFFDEGFQAGKIVSCEELRKASLPVRLRDALFWLFSPYL
ncbi:MAG: cardiolipin synthase [Betaproteobacteria bacterium]|nr:cardiolipin synthase [Betaproteobacteria bacterium]